MTEYLDEIAQRFEQSKNDKGFDITKLETKTKVTLKTKNSQYEVTYIEGNRAFVTGGLLANGGVRFPEPTEILIIGCSWGSSMLKIGWIGCGLRFEFSLAQGGMISTSPILDVTIEDPNGNWTYPMEWQKDLTKSE
jgi:hypothetical protein